MVELEKLASAIRRHTITDGGINTLVPGLLLFRSAPSNRNADMYEPSLCVVAQGAKEVLLEGEFYRYDPAHSLLVSVDLPVCSRVVEATPEHPCLVVRVSIDPAVVGELLAEGVGEMAGPAVRGIAASPVEPLLLDAVTRFVALLDRPQDIVPLAPLLLREITYRVLSRSAGVAAPPDRVGRCSGPTDRSCHPLAQRQLQGIAERRGACQTGWDEPVSVPPSLQGLDGAQPAPVPEAAQVAGGTSADVGRGARCWRCGVPRRVREPVAVRTGIPSDVRQPTPPGCGSDQGRSPANAVTRFLLRGE